MQSAIRVTRGVRLVGGVVVQCSWQKEGQARMEQGRSQKVVDVQLSGISVPSDRLLSSWVLLRSSVQCVNVCEDWQ